MFNELATVPIWLLHVSSIWNKKNGNFYLEFFFNKTYLFVVRYFIFVLTIVLYILQVTEVYTNLEVRFKYEMSICHWLIFIILILIIQQEFAKLCSIFPLASYIAFCWFIFSKKINVIYAFTDKLNSKLFQPQDGNENT